MTTTPRSQTTTMLTRLWNEQKGKMLITLSLKKTKVSQLIKAQLPLSYSPFCYLWNVDLDIPKVVRKDNKGQIEDLTGIQCSPPSKQYFPTVKNLARQHQYLIFNIRELERKK